MIMCDLYDIIRTSLAAIETCIQYETDKNKLNMLYARKKNLEELLNIE